jgi:dipeptidyl aminopeptidase/acylaminoacyl peptidase
LLLIRAQYPSSYHQKPISADYRFNNSDNQKKPLIIFVHGFKGFKDWGVFNLMADAFANKGFVFLKLNLSHNGTTLDSPTYHDDLEAFGNNNFSIELNDLKDVIDYCSNGSDETLSKAIDTNQIHLMGHSRGGGLVLLKAREDERISKVVTLAAISDLTQRWPQSFLDEWREKGVQHIPNSRTGQQMPLYVQLYDDVLNNMERLSIPDSVKQMKQPLLAFHGTEDETLPVNMAHDIKSWKPETELIIYEGANHVFGAAHPWEKDELPDLFKDIVEKSSEFLR